MNSARLGLYGWTMLGLTAILAFLSPALGAIFLAVMWTISLAGVIVISATLGVKALLEMIPEMDLPGAVFLIPPIFLIGVVYNLMGESFA